MRAEFVKKQEFFEARLKQKIDLEENADKLRIEQLEETLLEIGRENEQEIDRLERKIDEKQRGIEKGQAMIAEKQRELEVNAVKQRDSIRRSIHTTVQ